MSDLFDVDKSGMSLTSTTDLPMMKKKGKTIKKSPSD